MEAGLFFFPVYVLFHFSPAFSLYPSFPVTHIFLKNSIYFSNDKTSTCSVRMLIKYRKPPREKKLPIINPTQ